MQREGRVSPLEVATMVTQGRANNEPFTPFCSDRSYAAENSALENRGSGQKEVAFTHAVETAFSYVCFATERARIGGAFTTMCPVLDGKAENTVCVFSIYCGNRAWRALLRKPHLVTAPRP